MRKLILVSLIAVLACAACGSSSATQAAAGGGTPADGGGTPVTVASAAGDCGYWCGTGSATVTVGGTTTTISGGGCYDGASKGVDFRVGDFQNSTGGKDNIIALIYHGGTKTPTVSGTAGGKTFVLGSDATGTIDNGKGSFSGTDILGNGKITATLSCS